MSGRDAGGRSPKGRVNAVRVLRTLRADPYLAPSVRHIEAHETIGSTNASALDDDREALVVVALEQTAGRGRLGSTWASPRGGLYLSYAPPQRLVPMRPTDMTVLAGLACADSIGLALARVGVEAPFVRLKWPNDVLLRDGKVAGVLVQSKSPAAATGRPARTVVGIGINVNTPIVFPRLAEGLGVQSIPPVSMREAAGAPVPLEPLLVDIVKGLVLRLDVGLGRKVLEEYKARCATLGAGVTFTEGAATVSGRAVDVDADGALVVELADGSKRRVSSGEVRHLRESG